MLFVNICCKRLFSLISIVCFKLLAVSLFVIFLTFNVFALDIMENDEILLSNNPGILLSDLNFTSPVLSTQAGRFVIDSADVMNGNFTGAVDTHAVFSVAEGITFSVANRLSSAFNTSGTISFIGSGTISFSSNTENMFGGAVYAEGDVTFNNSAVFSGNSSLNGSGGAIFSNTGNVYLGDGTHFSGNMTANLGGGIFAGGDVEFGDSATLDNNTGGEGGAVIAVGSITFGDNAELTDNIATYGQGGAAESGTGNITFGNGASISGNVANTSGGALWAANDIIFSDNASLTGNTSSTGSGGAVTAYNNAEFGDNAVIMDNTAGHGGGAVYSGIGSITFGNNAVLTGNEAENGHGGAVSAKQTASFGDNALLSGNISSGVGGAVAATNVIFGESAEITNNTAYTTGAIYSFESAVFGEGTTLSGNVSTGGSGGAVYSEGTVDFSDDAEISGNSAYAYGGGVYSENTVTFGNGAVLTDNTAAYGGALLMYNGAVFGNSAELKGNTAGYMGGAVYSASGNLEFGADAVISGNSATYGPGGAVYAATGDVVFGNNTSLTDNTASGPGGAVYAGRNITFNTQDDGVTLISGNLAEGEANSIFFVTHDSVLTVNTEDNSVVDMRDPVSAADLTAVDVVKTGSGVWKLGGVNDFGEGTLQITEGTLYLYSENEVSNGYDSLGNAKGVAAGEISAGLISISENAEIAGSGTVNNAISLSGTLSPGNSIGVITMNSVIFENGSVYEVEINSDGTSDLAIIAGNAELSGGHVSVLAENGDWGNFTAFTILEAGSLTGEFQGISSNLAFLDPFLKYENNSVILDVYRNDASFESVARTYNQKNISSALAALGTDSEVYKEILGMSAASARSAFDSMNGEIHATAISAVLNNSRLIRDSLTAHLIERTDVKITAENSAWVKLFGFTADTDSDGNAAKYDADGQILIGGVDFQPMSSGRFGIALGFESGKVEIREGRNSDADIKTIHLGAYGSYDTGFAEFRAGGLMGFSDVDTERTAEAGGIIETLDGDYRTRIFQAFAEVGKKVDLGKGNIMPFIGAAYIYTEADSFNEVGGDMALAVSDYSDSMFAASFGLRGNVAFSGIFSLGAHVVYQRITEGYEPERRSRFVSGGSGFETKGLPLDEDSFIIGTDLKCNITEAVNLSVGYGGSFGDYITEHHGKASISVAF